MLDSSDPTSPAAAAAEAGQVQPQRRAAGAVPQAHDGGYASGGWEREDGTTEFDYSSFRGKRSYYGDFYDVKLTEVDGNL
ncbi:hypothetical protein HU200_046919 [Digitaria exilis]|uniref:Uncharacterized protein n=1 Tax=Digitaria exilis TaxID=1010633 RepID=A0A835AY55_9POAL|nr:hypothetical protein HU200_046919 [Digitaria exilis]